MGLSGHMSGIELAVARDDPDLAAPSIGNEGAYSQTRAYRLESPHPLRGFQIGQEAIEPRGVHSRGPENLGSDPLGVCDYDAWCSHSA